jgi:hypothetical protein
MTDEPPHRKRKFAELADVDVVERRRLRELAVADPALAEEELAGMLCRSRTTVIRRYIREVLMGVADHDDWTRENARMPSEAEVLASLIGRALSVEEAGVGIGIEELAPAQTELPARSEAGGNIGVPAAHPRSGSSCWRNEGGAGQREPQSWYERWVRGIRLGPPVLASRRRCTSCSLSSKRKFRGRTDFALVA